MALKYWKGPAGDASYLDPGNWSDDQLPVAGDVAVLGGDPAEGPSNISGEDATSIGGHSLIVGANWSGNIGGDADALSLDLTSFDYAGTGQCRINRQGSTTANVNIRNTGAPVSSGQFRALELAGTAAITNIRIMGGHEVYFASPFCDVSSVEVIGAGLVDVYLTGCSITNMKCNSGKVQFGICDNVEISGDAIAIADSTITVVGNVDVYGGTLKWSAKGSVSTIFSGLRVFSGLFDATECTSTTTDIRNAEVFGDAVVDERGVVSEITWSNGLRMHGGVYRCDGGRVVTPT